MWFELDLPVFLFYITVLQLPTLKETYQKKGHEVPSTGIQQAAAAKPS